MDNPIFVAFEPIEEGFRASVSMEQLDSLGPRPEAYLQKAAKTYRHHVEAMRHLLSEMDRQKAKRTPISARSVWELGDAVLHLLGELGQESLEVDSLYEHLSRDLPMNEKRLGTVVTFRRHLPSKDLIPESLGWSQCEKNARKVAENLRKGRKETPQIALL